MEDKDILDDFDLWDSPAKVEQEPEALFPSPMTDYAQAGALTPIVRRGRRMPGSFNYSPNELWEMFRRYALDFMPTRKLYRTEMLKGGLSAGQTVNVEMQAPMSLETFLVFSDISKSRFDTYAKKPEYKEVTEMIEMAIFGNNYEMAACGLIHAGLVARKHKMADTTDLQSGGRTIDMPLIQFSLPKKASASGGLSVDVNDDL